LSEQQRAWAEGDGEGRLERSRAAGIALEARLAARTMPELEPELRDVVNIFDPWARDRGDYYDLT
jgi:hypothetical protein